MVINPNESLNKLGKKNKNFYTFPQAIAKEFIHLNESSDTFSGFIALYILEKCIETGLFTKPFIEFKDRNSNNNKNLEVISNKFIQQVEKNL